MNYYKIFYWLTVADNAKDIFITFGILFLISSLISTIVFLVEALNEKSEDAAKAKKWMWWSWPFCLLLWSMYVFTPSKRDSLLILAGGGALNFLTTDTTAKQIPHELTSFVITELKSMSEEAKTDININDQKDKILDEAKNMTSDQLIDKMKSDSSFAKVILNK
jgi:hypothetical protein